MKRSQRKADKINELILTTKADLKEGPDNIIVLLGLCFLLIIRVLENWTIFMEVICVSSLRHRD